MKDHADTPADLGSRSAVVDVYLSNSDLSGGTSLGYGLVHAVDTTHKGGLPTTGWANDSRGAVRRHANGDVMQSLGLPEPGVEMFDLDAYAHINSFP